MAKPEQSKLPDEQQPQLKVVPPPSFRGFIEADAIHLEKKLICGENVTAYVGVGWRAGLNGGVRGAATGMVTRIIVAERGGCAYIGLSDHISEPPRRWLQVSGGYQAKLSSGVVPPGGGQ